MTEQEGGMGRRERCEGQEGGRWEGQGSMGGGGGGGGGGEGGVGEEGGGGVRQGKGRAMLTCLCQWPPLSTSPPMDQRSSRRGHWTEERGREGGREGGGGRERGRRGWMSTEQGTGREGGTN